MGWIGWKDRPERREADAGEEGVGEWVLTVVYWYGDLGWCERVAHRSSQESSRRTHTYTHHPYSTFRLSSFLFGMGYLIRYFYGHCSADFV
jgi:hypothetical protein